MGGGTLLALSAFLWTDLQFNAVGCTGNVLKGLACPDRSLLTRMAVTHSGAAVFALVAFTVAGPIAAVVAAAMEWSGRKRRPPGD